MTTPPSRNAAGYPPTMAPATSALPDHPWSDSDRMVLLIEDEETIGRNLVTGLAAHGYPTRWSRTGSGGLARARVRPPDVVLLDLGLPDLDGVQLARTLRTEFPRLLLIILTARADDMDVVIGLDAGADDYLSKPFSLTVLLARLRAHLRTRPAAEPAGKPVRVGDVTLDAAARRCHLNHREIDLRPKEFDLLYALARHAGVAMTREDLMAQVWDENWFGSTKTLDVTMAALRRALSPATSAEHAPVITTLRGYGYRLEVPSDVPSDAEGR